LEPHDKLHGNGEKYYKKFDFFYRRTAFRTMTEFYKQLFRPYHERFKELDKKMAAHISKGDCPDLAFSKVKNNNLDRSQDSKEALSR
jgi:hypothetical protein